MGSPERLVWIDGSVVPASEATVSTRDHGLVVGDGAFETLRVLGGVPFALTRHLDRLLRTLDALDIPGPDRAHLTCGMHDAIAANGIDDGRMRLTVTAGLGPLGSGRAEGPPTVIVAVEPSGPPANDRLVVSPWTRNDTGALAGLKTTSYAENVRALRFANDRGADEALLHNTRGQLCEGTGTNLFVVIDGQILTPPLSSGCLAGVTRALVMELVAVVERDLPAEVLGHADEVFVTSTTRDVAGIARVDDRRYPAPGPVTEATATAFADLVARDLDP